MMLGPHGSKTIAHASKDSPMVKDGPPTSRTAPMVLKPSWPFWNHPGRTLEYRGPCYRTIVNSLGTIMTTHQDHPVGRAGTTPYDRTSAEPPALRLTEPYKPPQISPVPPRYTQYSPDIPSTPDIPQYLPRYTSPIYPSTSPDIPPDIPQYIAPDISPDISPDIPQPSLPEYLPRYTPVPPQIPQYLPRYTPVSPRYTPVPPPDIPQYLPQIYPSLPRYTPDPRYPSPRYTPGLPQILPPQIDRAPP
ncbi:DNA-directed RNA polymerase II subunit RPB1-like [Homarus americanus]|uniref:DNA-directed RNA polymerase II subunit RPB1-like n=1 Tax=Homarus americanus TaxID=6706 RepID=UPI001C478B79|nr:DNA-directed RNA polymerase II subunit RPB1-like [Homarus americanus]